MEFKARAAAAAAFRRTGKLTLLILLDNPERPATAYNARQSPRVVVAAHDETGAWVIRYTNPVGSFDPDMALAEAGDAIHK